MILSELAFYFYFSITLPAATTQCPLDIDVVVADASTIAAQPQVVLMVLELTSRCQAVSYSSQVRVLILAGAPGSWLPWCVDLQNGKENSSSTMINHLTHSDIHCK